MKTKYVQRAFAVVLLGLAGTGCGDSHGPGGESTAQTEEAVTLDITLSNEVGRLITSGNGLTRSYFAYDSRGRTAAVEHVLDNTPYVFTSTYGFQCNGNSCSGTTTAPNGPVVVSATFPGAPTAGLQVSETVNYTFDAGDGAQAIVTTPAAGTAQTIVSRVLRNSRGQTVEVDYGDATSTIHHYNDTTDLRLNELETYVTAVPTTVLGLYEYAFDGNGNVWSVTDYCNESSTGSCSSTQSNTTYSATYSYDSRDELVQAVRGGVTYPYAYDSVANLTNMEGTAQTYFPSGSGKTLPHALESVGSVTYEYDADGNTTGTTGATHNLAITWNAQNMPVSTAYNGNTTTKSFIGESLWKKVLGATTTYYLPSMRVEDGAYRKYFNGFAERDISDTTSCSVNAADGCLKFYHGDHLGSSTLVTNASSTVVHRQAYTPYGQDIVSSAPGPFTPKYQFSFKEKEEDGSDLYDFGARIYDPATGRWLSSDTTTRTNYIYASNNPVGRIDGDGHQDSTVFPQHPPTTDAEKEMAASGIHFDLSWIMRGAKAARDEGYKMLEYGSNIPVVGGLFHIGSISMDFVAGDKTSAGTKIAMTPLFFLPEGGEGAEGAGKALRTYAMDSQYAGEAAKGVVRYFSAEERNLFRLFVKDGKLVKANGELFHTAGEYGQFVMDKRGAFYGFEATSNAIHHSSFLAGEPVAAAGGLKVEHGVVELMDNASGHYRPPTSSLTEAVKQLKKQGLQNVPGTNPIPWR